MLFFFFYFFLWMQEARKQKRNILNWKPMHNKDIRSLIRRGRRIVTWIYEESKDCHETSLQDFVCLKLPGLKICIVTLVFANYVYYKGRLCYKTYSTKHNMHFELPYPQWKEEHSHTSNTNHVELLKKGRSITHEWTF